MTPFPQDAGPDRDTATLERIRAGAYAFTWAPLTSTIPGHTATFRVFADALRMDDILVTNPQNNRPPKIVPGTTFQGVRVATTATVAQQIADLLYASLLTPRLADLLFAQRAVTLVPMPMPITSSTEGMVRESLWIDAALAKQSIDPSNLPGIVQTVGKHWIIDNRLAQYGTSRAENYGWHFVGSSFGGLSGEPTVSLPGYRLIQGCGWAHDPSHVDYSQNLVLVSRVCVVDGKPMDLRTVLTDPSLAPLASHQGVMTVLRQPGVPELTPIVTPPCVDPGCPNLVTVAPGGNPGGSVPPASGNAGNVIAGAALLVGAGALIAHLLRSSS